MDSSALLLTGWSSLCQRPSCTLLFTAFMKLKLLYTFGDGKSRKNFQGGGKGFELGMRNEGGGFAAIDEEVAAVLAFVISHTTFLAAQDDETGRCPKVC